jgi:hypothetical protein
MFVCCECCVLSSRGLCDGLITLPEESYRLWRVVCDQETSEHEEAKARYRAVKIRPQWVVTPGKQTTTTHIYQSLHVSSDYGLIIRRNNCVFATLGTCYSVWMTVWCAGSTQNNKYQVSQKHSFS